MMRVAFDVTPLLGVRTGVGTFTAGAMNGLALRNDVSVIAYAVSWRGKTSLPEQIPPGVRTARSFMPADPLHAIWRRTSGPPIELWTGSVEVVHGTNYVVPNAWRAAEVVTVHDLTCVRYPQMCHPVSLRYPELIRRAARRGAIVHTPSRAMAEEVVQLLDIPPEQVRTVYHGIDLPSGGDTSYRPTGNDGSPYILGLGTIEPRKDYPLLVRAFDEIAAAHADLRLIIAGPPAWGQDDLQRAINQATHRRRISCLGWVSSEERTKLLKNALVLAYPSVYEGFGLPPLEAMLVGTPVVATAAGALPEVIGDAGLLTPVGDTNALAAALSHVIDDDGERNRLIEKGRHRAAKFTWDHCAADLRSLYLYAIARRGKPGRSWRVKASYSST